jgi:hypothetical protein
VDSVKLVELWQVLKRHCAVRMSQKIPVGGEGMKICYQCSTKFLLEPVIGVTEQDLSI